MLFALLLPERICYMHHLSEGIKFRRISLKCKRFFEFSQPHGKASHIFPESGSAGAKRV